LWKFFRAIFFFFSRYKAYRDEQARLHAAWLERENARQAAIARGDPNPPAAEEDPTDAATVREVGLVGLCKFLVYVLLFALLAGKFVTGEWFWGEGGGLVRKSVWSLWPVQERLFSESLLAEFDGRESDRPLYLAVRFASSSSFSLVMDAYACLAVPFAPGWRLIWFWQARPGQGAQQLPPLCRAGRAV
jgi:hypothetical protein